MQVIANRLLNAFNDVVKVTKSHILAVNTLTRIHVPEEHKEIDSNVSRLKHGRPIGSKDIAPYKMRRRNQESTNLDLEQTPLRE